jgi:ribosomal protein S12 methylthiotransferase
VENDTEKRSERKRFHLNSLGCPKNLVDSEKIIGELLVSGWELVDDPALADVMIVNTCGFIQAAKEESIEEILRSVELKEESDGRTKVVVTGCLGQRYKDELRKEIPGIDAITGVHSTGSMSLICEQVYTGKKDECGCSTDHRNAPVCSPSPRFLLTPPHIAYMKIAEGCDNRCAYCAIPGIRGPYRSRSIDAIAGEAAALAGMAVKELILISQDTALYGSDIYGESSLHVLLRELAGTGSFSWIRIMYAHPAHITEKTLEAVADIPSVCRYIDVPLQHISERILESMGRKAGRRHIENLLHIIRQTIPMVALRTTFMIGYPGERETDVEELSDFMEKMRFDHVGFFLFSPEEDTPAFSYKPRVSRAVAENRQRRLMELQVSIALSKNRALVGKRIPVMIDSVDDRTAVGRTEWDAYEIDRTVRVRLCTPRPVRPGETVKVDIVKANHCNLQGVLREDRRSE